MLGLDRQGRKQKDFDLSNPVIHLSAIRIPVLNHTGRFKGSKFKGWHCTSGGGNRGLLPLGVSVQI